MERLSTYELVAVSGAILLVAALFGDWYESVSALATLAGHTGFGTYSGWEAHRIIRWALVLTAIAPFVLTYIVIRGHQLSWARGELTAILSIVAFGLLLYVGVIDRPGDPPGQIELRWGWYVALLGSMLMIAGSALRSGEVERSRKPPGTI
jgi:hypothetical protein